VGTIAFRHRGVGTLLTQKLVCQDEVPFLATYAGAIPCLDQNPDVHRATT